MAIDEADQSDAGDFSEGEASESASEANRSRGSDGDANSDGGVRVGDYTWEEFMEEYGYGDDASVLYPDDPGEAVSDDQLGLDTDEGPERTVPSGEDWTQVEFDPESYLGYHPDDLDSTVVPTAGDNAEELWDVFREYADPETTPVVKDTWTWEHYKWEYYYEDDGSRPRDSDGDIVRHDTEESLGFDPDTLEQRLSAADDAAMELDELVEERTVNVQEEVDEDEFFSTAAGNTTVTNRYDLEKAVPMDKKTHFREVERYWVNKPYACVVIFHSEKENEKKYYLIEPYLNEIELELQEFLSGKLRTAIKYSDEGIKEKATEDGRRTVIEDETRQLLKRYDLFEKTASGSQESILDTLRNLLDDDEGDGDGEDDGPDPLEGLSVRPEPAILEDDPDTLSEYQVEKLLYLLKRNFIGYERIDGIKHDINVEDISVDGYNSPVFVYHSEYEQIISNVYHGEDELDDFVVKLAQRSGKGISKRLPQVDATLPDGSRAQLTLGEEVSDHGTNYTIRQFKDVPFTPIDLINWNTFSLDEMAFLWLCIENHKSLIFAGGTASGKTTSLNAVSLFIPSSAKIVSIEDTREVELPQRNWIASVTRPSFADDEQGDVDEFDLLEAALRQRPDYIVMGEIRGEEGRTLFQVMSTGHTTYTTFHADSVDEVLKRFTTDPINVSKTMFTALDLVSIQTQTRVQGRKVRRNKSLTEINHYEAEHDEINVQDVYQWQAETDEFLKMGDSNTLEEIQFDRGWSREKLEEELFKREVILAYLIKNGLNTYAEVAATVQAFINDPDTILTLIANGQLEDSLEDLREMESVLIDVDPEKEELVPRPDATDETYNTSMDLLERAEESLFEEYRGKTPSGLDSALGGAEAADAIEVDGADADEFDFAGDVDDSVEDDEWELGDGSSGFGAGEDAGEPAWLSDDTGFDIGGDEGEAAADSAEAASSAGEGAAAETVGDGTTAGTGGDGIAAESPDADTADETSDGFEIDDETGGVSGPPAPAATANGADAEAETPQPAAADEAGTTVMPTDDAGDADLGGLFDDMDDTIDRLDADGQPEPPTEADAASTAKPDTSGFDSMFPEDDLESIFDPESDAETAGDFSDQFEPAIADEPVGDGLEPSDETAETPTIDLGGSADDPAEGDETSTVGSEASTDEGIEADETPTIDLGGAADDSAATDDDAEEIVEPEADAGSSSIVDDGSGNGVALEDGDSIVAGEPTDDASESDATSSADDRSERDGRLEGDGDDRSADEEPTATAADPPGEDRDEPTEPAEGDDDGVESESIFGTESDSIFSEESATDDSDDGSLFDDEQAQAETDDSIFKPAESEDDGPADGETDPADDTEDTDT
ncbi:Flp pilus assembly complex ATPase component TadA [Haloterrigena sp. SYSU A558-1]|uniref:Flp pilus assembly complex ATPase component TadA n=1 Tax=Haloterrigena gelatinilytica TaxID=2741724 RepID=A0ABX2LE18_9EURY|nr:ATPase, T2SS/T4P/T4SS family [Haloterrigena gelatinilytica]NUC73103.1 Flp pilus assembly complex ATPase component TadA [Haloterrigena gelatinilytica]